METRDFSSVSWIVWAMLKVTLVFERFVCCLWGLFREFINIVKFVYVDFVMEI